MINRENEKRVLLHGYFNKNLGDDLFFDILFKRYKNVVFYIYGLKKNILWFKRYQNVKLIFQPNSKIFKLLFSLMNKDYNLFMYRREFNKSKYKNISAIVTIGGSIFMENPGKRQPFSKMKEDFLLFPNVKQFLLGCNFGPFKTEKFFNEKKDLISKFEDVYFRDIYSYQLFEGLPNIRYGLDIVLKYFNKKSTPIDNSIGFALTPYRTNDVSKKRHYERKCAEVIFEAVKKKYIVTLFSFCEPEGDLLLIQNILNQIHDKSVRKLIKVVSYNGNLEEFLNIFLSQEYILAGRYHAFVLCLKNKINVVPIIYNIKQKNLISDINYVGKTINISDLSNIDNEFLFMNTSEYTIENCSEPFEKLDLFLSGKKSNE